MNRQQTLGFVLLPLVLIVLGVAINRFALWSYLGNLTVPWLCTTLAFAMLSLGLVSMVMNRPPHELPKWVCGLIVGLISVMIGAGMAVDYYAYAEPADMFASLGEWLGTTVIFTTVFFLPALRAFAPSREAKS